MVKIPRGAGKEERGQCLRCLQAGPGSGASSGGPDPVGSDQDVCQWTRHIQKARPAGQEVGWWEERRY